MSIVRAYQRLTSHVDGAWLHSDDRPADSVGLALQWLGTAGFRVVRHGHHVWLDPHLSRHSLGQLALGRIAPKIEAIARDVDKAHAVLVGHSHFDHAIDTPVIARMHGARVYGASDTLNWCRGDGVPESQLRELRGDGEEFTEGPFTIRGIRSAHSPFLAGRVPFPGRITTPFPGPAKMSAWRVGQVFGLHLSGGPKSLYHVGSADLIEAELKDTRADVVLCCTIGRHATPHFVERVVQALRPSLLIPCHWDQFWRPLDSVPLQIPGNDLDGFIQEVQRLPNAPAVRVLPPRGWAVLDP